MAISSTTRTLDGDAPTETSPLIAKRPAETGNEIKAPESSAKRLWVLPALAIGVFLGAADQTIVISSYGLIGSELNALNKASWLATAYLLPLCSFQLLYGKLSDIFGRKYLFVFAYAVFGIGCLLCGLARTMDELIIARVVAGAGGGGFNTLATIVISDLVPLRQRGLWQGVRNLVVGIGLGVGSLGGSLTESIGWRWSFLIQVPFSIIGLVNVLLIFENKVSLDKESWRRKLRRVDLGGAILVITAVSFLLVGLDTGANQAWNSPLTIGSLVASLVLSAAFIYVEVNVATEPFASKEVLYTRTVGSSILSNFFTYACWLALLYHLPLYWQAVEGRSAAEISLRLLPGIIPGIFGSLAAGVVIQYTGRFYWLTIITYGGMVVSVVPIIMCTGWVVRSTIAVMLSLGLCALCLNTAVTSSLVALMAHSTNEDQASAISCLQLARSLGSEVGLALGAATLQQILRSQLRAQIPLGDGTGDISDLLNGEDDLIRHITQSLGHLDFLDPAARELVKQAYDVAFRWSFMLCLAFALAAFVTSVPIRDKRLIGAR